MKLSAFKAVSPAGVPVGSIPFRGEGVLDIYPMRTKDLFWIANRAPAVAAAFALEGDARIPAIIKALAETGEDVVNRLLCVATRCSPEELQEQELSLDDDVEILVAFLDLGVPDDFFGRLAGAVNRRTGGALSILATSTSKPSSPASSSASEKQDSTPTS